MLKKFWVVGILITALLLMLQGRVTAQPSYNLQSDIYVLRAEVSQLRAQVAQLSARQGAGAAPSRSPAPTSRARSPELSDQQMLDRLAILAIEAKDRLNALEGRMAALEGRSK
ncbi:hypothetical protein ACN4EK_21445 [Pantanalinema rosaneae CENA516]|uniref:hypothetical protein n=1 Tax=Pantanalinema rosaneae TaxID=1620701 RepID=UPI003D6EA668